MLGIAKFYGSILLGFVVCTNPSSPDSTKLSLADCWETGYQPDTWLVTGCLQYACRETKRRPCKGGTRFTCCMDNFGGGNLDKYGDMTYYNLGMTACGQVHKDTDLVAAIALGYWTTAKQNRDPICGRRIKIVDPTSGKEVAVKVVDKCRGCKMADVDVSWTAFRKLRILDVGRFKVKWGFL